VRQSGRYFVSGLTCRAQPAQCGRGQGATDDSSSHGDEAQAVVAGMGPPSREGLLHIEAFSLGHHPLGLFDHDAAVEGVLELLVYDRTDINAMEA
jgi:hypothetical protein